MRLSLLLLLILSLQQTGACQKEDSLFSKIELRAFKIVEKSPYLDYDKTRRAQKAQAIFDSILDIEQLLVLVEHSSPIIRYKAFSKILEVDTSKIWYQVLVHHLDDSLEVTYRDYPLPFSRSTLAELFWYKVDGSFGDAKCIKDEGVLTEEEFNSLRTSLLFEQNIRNRAAICFLLEDLPLETNYYDYFLKEWQEHQDFCILEYLLKFQTDQMVAEIEKLLSQANPMNIIWGREHRG